MQRTAFLASVSGSARRSAGFSLVELIVSIVVLGVLAAVTAPIFSSSLRVYVESDAHLTTLGKARYATERIARELREVQRNAGAYSFSVMGPNNMTFTKQDGTIVALSVAGGNMNMSYTPPGVMAPLTDELSALSFTYLTAAGTPGASAATVVSVDVSLSLSNRGATHTQRVRVGLRNQQ